MPPVSALQDDFHKRLLLAGEDYELDRVRVANRDLAGFTHIVTTRKGLFAVRQGEWKLLAYGQFYGIALRQHGVYVFQACNATYDPTARGRLVHFEREGDRLTSVRVIAKGLDNGVHQMDFVDGSLCVVDTYNQQVLRFHPDGEVLEPRFPLAKLAERWSGKQQGYVHANSLLAVGNKILLLLHNQWRHTGECSEVLLCDLAWQPLERWTVPARSGHDLALLEEGTLLLCDSESGDLIGTDDFRVHVSPYLTRGLAVGEDSIVVGASRLANRETRERVTGTITFLNRSYVIESVLELPAAPMDIKRLDGRDGSSSEYLARVRWGKHLKTGAAYLA